MLEVEKEKQKRKLSISKVLLLFDARQCLGLN